MIIEAIKLTEDPRWHAFNKMVDQYKEEWAEFDVWVERAHDVLTVLKAPVKK